jgi:hypothetical protein
MLLDLFYRHHPSPHSSADQTDDHRSA